MSLQGRRILVVRPQQLPALGDDQFVQQLGAAGAEPLHCPVMAIEPFAIPDANSPCSATLETIKSQVLDLASYHAAIFVSRPAAYLGAQWITHYWPQLPVGVQCYAVGDSTAVVLAQQGIQAAAPQQQLNTEGLLLLPGLQQLHDKKVLVFRGCGGRESLAETLRDRGAAVHCAELYQRQQINDCQQQIGQALQSGLDAVVVHSGELLQALLQLLSKPQRHKLQSLPLLVPGQRLQLLAQRAGFENIVVSATALPQGMVSALSRWYISGS